MFKYNCLNPIASVGLDLFSNDYEKVEDLDHAWQHFLRVLRLSDLSPLLFHSRLRRKMHNVQI